MTSFKKHSKLCRSMAVALLTIAMPTLASESMEQGVRHLIYLPSNTDRVDHAAIIQGFIGQGFEVTTLPYAGEDSVNYARRVAGVVRTLMQQGVAAEYINVVGAGTGSPIALLTSAAVGNRNINYVVLGQCDPLLKQQHRFRLSGDVLGVRDVADSGSHSCRPFWQNSPKLRGHQDLALDTGHGAALFDQPRDAWMQPMLDWSTGGKVTVGELQRVTTTEPVDSDSSGRGSAD